MLNKTHPINYAAMLYLTIIEIIHHKLQLKLYIMKQL